MMTVKVLTGNMIYKQVKFLWTYFSMPTIVASSSAVAEMGPRCPHFCLGSGARVPRSMSPGPILVHLRHQLHSWTQYCRARTFKICGGKPPGPHFFLDPGAKGPSQYVPGHTFVYAKYQLDSCVQFPRAYALLKFLAVCPTFPQWGCAPQI